MYSILNCLLFLLVQITQDAVLYTCRFPGTATSLGSAKDCPVPQAFEELEQCTVQQCQQCQSLSMGVQHNFGTPFSPTRVPSITKATKQPFLHPPAGINHQQAGCGTAALHMDTQTAAATPGGGAAKIPPRFSADPALCTCEPRAGRAPGLHPSLGGSSLFPAPRGAAGEGDWLKSVLRLWSGRARAVSSSALWDRSAVGTGALGKGLALHSCTSSMLLWVHS